MSESAAGAPIRDYGLRWTERASAMPNLARCTSASGAPLRDLLIGFGLVVFASAGICLSLNLQKLVHMRNADPQTNQPRVHFTRLPLWWVAVVGNGISELVNLAALGFAPATLVGPLGCLTVTRRTARRARARAPAHDARAHRRRWCSTR